MRDILIVIIEIILISLMLIHPVLSNYRRYLIGKSKTLFTLRHNKFWTRDSAFFAIFIGIPAVFFIIVGIATIVKGTELPLYGWLSILSSIVFFGNLSFNSSPFRAKTIFTENGIISAYGNYYWRSIKGYEWGTDFKQNYILRIVTKNINIYFTIRGLTANAEDKEVISQIFDGKLKRKTVI
ncbi:MAG: hypothetical protein HZC48_01550 [Nitrospirae bacterium]|nr:hypothetical protein [Nitrospirota bacterium]